MIGKIGWIGIKKKQWIQKKPKEPKKHQKTSRNPKPLPIDRDKLRGCK